MGYTHYWTIYEPFSEQEWNELLNYTFKILQITDVEICGPLGDESPVLTDDFISLNGDRSRDEDHETFRFDNQPISFNFVKTNRKPYDEVVTAILMIAERIAPDKVSVRSDGTDDDWAPGYSLVRRLS